MELQWGKVSNAMLEIIIKKYYNIIILITLNPTVPPFDILTPPRPNALYAI